MRTEAEGLKIATAWIDRDCPAEYPDHGDRMPNVTVNGQPLGAAPEPWPQGIFVYRQALLDFDYHMAYLLEVRSHDSIDTWVSEYLFVYQKHAGTSELTVQWFDAPVLHVFDKEGGRQQYAAARRFTEWVHQGFRL